MGKGSKRRRESKGGPPFSSYFSSVGLWVKMKKADRRGGPSWSYIPPPAAPFHPSYFPPFSPLLLSLYCLHFKGFSLPPFHFTGPSSPIYSIANADFQIHPSLSLTLETTTVSLYLYAVRTHARLCGSPELNMS